MELSYSEDELEEAARKVWAGIAPGAPVAVQGEMGSGKTTLIQAICRILGVTGGMSSPSFSIINVYDAPSGPVYHIDLYRCADAAEAQDAGVEECLWSGRPCFVEWPERAPSIFPPGTAHIWLEGSGGDKRRLRWQAGEPGHPEKV